MRRNSSPLLTHVVLQRDVSRPQRYPMGHRLSLPFAVTPADRPTSRATPTLPTMARVPVTLLMHLHLMKPILQLILNDLVIQVSNGSLGLLGEVLPEPRFQQVSHDQVPAPGPRRQLSLSSSRRTRAHHLSHASPSTPWPSSTPTCARPVAPTPPRLWPSLRWITPTIQMRISR
jgi:hypothetical protein